MSSSTFSSSPGTASGACCTAEAHRAASRRTKRSHLLSIVVVLVCQVALDAYVRLAGHRLHGDIRMLHDASIAADALAAKDGMRCAFMGNSLAIGGYGDFSIFRRSAQEAGFGEIQCAPMGIYSSTLAEWYCIFKREYVDNPRAIDAVVINASPGSLGDHSTYIRASWLPAEAGLGNMVDVLTWVVRDPDTRGEYLMASASSLYARRSQLRWCLHGWWVRYYGEGWTRINDTLKELTHRSAERQTEQKAPTPPSYELLRRMCQLARQRGILVVFVAMPIRDSYEIEPELRATIEREGMRLVDARSIAGITRDMYIEDGWHLRKAGAEIFAAHMGREIPRAVGQRIRAKDSR